MLNTITYLPLIAMGFLFSCAGAPSDGTKFADRSNRNNDSTQKVNKSPTQDQTTANESDGNGQLPPGPPAPGQPNPKGSSPTPGQPGNPAGSSTAPGTPPGQDTAYGPITTALCKTAFDPAKIPSLKNMVKVFLNELAYTNESSPKALALNDEGFGIPVILPPGTQPSDVKKLALNRCSGITGGGNCRIIAVGNTFCPDGPEAPQALQKPKNLKDLPFGTTDAYGTGWLASESAAYQSALVPKAVAISLDGEVFWDYAINSNVNGVITKERRDNLEASRIAMEKCELSSKLSPCTLLATGDTIVFDPTALNWDPKINFNPRVLSKPALITPDNGYDTFWVTNSFPGGDPAQFKGAIFVSQDGASWISTPNVTDTNTRASCQGISERRKPCFKFVQDGRIVATPSPKTSVENVV